MALTNEFDGDAIALVIQEMEATDGVCDAVNSGVEATGGFLASNWVGNASAKYLNALQQWQAGLAEVKAGLHDLGVALDAHRNVTGMLEEDNSQYADFTGLAGYNTVPTWT